MDTGLARLLRPGTRPSLAFKTYGTAFQPIRSVRIQCRQLSRRPSSLTPFFRPGHRTLVGVGMMTFFTLLPWGQAARCAAVSGQDSKAGTSDEDDPISKALQALGPVGSEITMGAVLGFCSGYAVKKVGKAAAFVVGVTFIATQAAAYMGIVDINWRKVETEALRVIDQDGDKKFDQKDLSILWNKLKKVLLYQLPSSGGFLAGFSVGFYRG